MFSGIRKRDGRVDEFDADKITLAIFKAARSVGGSDLEKSQALTAQVIEEIHEQYQERLPDVEAVQDLVEKVLIENGHAKTAKAYILYREKRGKARDMNALIGATIEMFNGYLDDSDWRVRENANSSRSVNGLNNYVREFFTQRYWLHEVYPQEIRETHESGAGHIHDLGFLGPYCAGWDLKLLLMDGFGGVAGKVESKPAKHLRAFLGQIVNSTFTTAGESAGAQAWSSIDTYCAPFIRYDGLTYKQVRQCVQEFVFNLNVPTRVGFQCPFSNLTFDLTVPSTLANEPVIIGGELMEEKYEDFQEEMDMFNRAFCEVMLEGDAKGRVFTFPIPTINVTKNFDWNLPSVDAFMKITCKYGIPYFANYVNSDLSPEDAVSMCCRLRLNTSELRKRGGGLFGSNPLTGSVGVFTINLPRIGHLSQSKEEFFASVKDMIRIGSESLEIKRKVVERQTNMGLYPYCAKYLNEVKQRTGNYWHNHFSTIGIVGMNEALLNLKGIDLASEEGQEFSIELMDMMRDELVRIQEETGNPYNLEATPAEGTSYRLALLDKKKFPEIITSGCSETPYYTNSTQLPVGYSEDLFDVLDLQDELQSMYTGGTVLHMYMGQRVEDVESVKSLIQNVFTNYKLPYLSLTPSFSVCPEHGYLKGEQPVCPHCGKETEIWSRVTGYLRPLSNFNNGKKREFSERVKYLMPNPMGDECEVCID